MRQSRSAKLVRPWAIGAIATTALALAACSTPAPAGTDAPSEEPLQIAYISFAVANTYDEPMLAEAQKVADANNAVLTVLDGNLDPNLQVTLIQDAIASGQYGSTRSSVVFSDSVAGSAAWSSVL